MILCDLENNPCPNHSIFTGHLIEALNGNAKTSDDVLAASGIMSYVYERVAKDPHSNQTPHCGFFEGDGDFIFKAPFLDKPVTEAETDNDLLVSIPVSSIETSTEDSLTLAEKIKELLSERKYTIKLHDVVMHEIRSFLSLTADDFFAVQGKQWSPDSFKERIGRYEEITQRLQATATCLAHWGADEHRGILAKIMAMMTDRLEPESGLVIWIALRWYPILLLTYSAGIASVASKNYHNLAVILQTNVRSTHSQSELKPVAASLADALSETHDAFKTLPGHERNHVHRSEYLFKLLQPMLDEPLFLGRDYETYFDRFEVLLALICADHLKRDGHLWGPPGRFAYKYRRPNLSAHPFGQIIQEAEAEKDHWAPLKAGLFQGSYERFNEIATEYKELIKHLNWL